MASCPFCRPTIDNQILSIHGTVFAIFDKYPVTQGHRLIIPIRHIPDYFAMSVKERRDADELIFSLKNQIETEDTSVVGYNIGINCGEAAGQTIEHAHIHLIPRRKGDTPDPRGGIRGAVPSKMSY